MNLLTFEPKKTLDHFLFADPFYGFPRADRSHEHSWERPKVNVIEKDDSFLVEAETPGISEKDVSIEIHNGVLTIRSKYEESTEEKKDDYHVREFSRNHFDRSFKFNDQVDPEKVTAKMEQGILKVILLKVEKEKPKKIAIKPES